MDLNNLTEGQKKPVFTVDGKPWCQNCLYCGKQVNFFKTISGIDYIRIGDYIRHKKCYPTGIIK
jgi:hypothetical protein